MGRAVRPGPAEREERSGSWVSQVERDIQPIERIGVLRDLAAALGVSVHDLRPTPAPRHARPRLPGRRRRIRSPGRARRRLGRRRSRHHGRRAGRRPPRAGTRWSWTWPPPRRRTGFPTGRPSSPRPLSERGELAGLW